MIILDNGKPKMRWVQHLKKKLPKKIKLIVVDEGFTIPEQNALDLLSFGLPIVVLGDSNMFTSFFANKIFLSLPINNQYFFKKKILLSGNPREQLIEKKSSSNYINYETVDKDSPKINIYNHKTGKTQHH